MQRNSDIPNNITTTLLAIGGKMVEFGDSETKKEGAKKIAEMIDLLSAYAEKYDISAKEILDNPAPDDIGIPSGDGYAMAVFSYYYLAFCGYLSEYRQGRMGVEELQGHVNFMVTTGLLTCKSILDIIGE